MSEKITFLFGAGCEGKGTLELPMGEGFKRDTILANNVKDLIEAVNDTKSRKFNNGHMLSWNAKSILYQTFNEFSDEINKYDFSPDELKIIKDYLEYKADQNAISEDERKTQNETFQKFYYDEFYTKITDESLDLTKLKDNDKLMYFLENASFYSFVDSQFNHLRKPENYLNETNRVIKLYYAAFLSILNGLIETADKTASGENYRDVYKKSVVNKKVSRTEARKSLEKVITETQEKIAEIKGTNEKVYYNMLKKHFGAAKTNPENIHVVTSNYTDFVEVMSGLKKENIAYVHGRMDLFEDLESKHVGPISDFEETDFIFPFIFVQSGVKPVVSPYQLHQLSNAAKWIDEADELFIIGYNVNTDDEHLTNMLRERLRNNGKKRINCFLYTDGLAADEIDRRKKRIQKALIYEDRVDFFETSDFENKIEEFLSASA